MFPFDGAPSLHNFLQGGNHVRNVSGALDDEVQRSSGGVYEVATVDFANALERVGGMGRGLGAMPNQIDLDAVGTGHGAALRPPSIDLVDIFPYEYLGGDRLADEG